MKEIFDWLREQMKKAEYNHTYYGTDLAVNTDKAIDIIDEAEAKWKESEAELRASVIDEFAEKVVKRIKEEVTLLESEREEAREYDDEQVIFATNNQLRAFDYSLRVIADVLKGEHE